MAYPFEMHFHTDEVSPCGNVPAAEAAAAYRREGYAGVVVTDHYAAYNFARFPGDWDTKVDAYLAGYRAAKAAGEPLGLTVLLGLELRLDGAEKTGEPALDALRDSINEYLVYGVTEEQLRRYPALYTLDEKRLQERSLVGRYERKSAYCPLRPAAPPHQRSGGRRKTRS